MKTKKRSKILSLLLALSMLVGMVPFSVIPAMAAGFGDVQVTSSYPYDPNPRWVEINNSSGNKRGISYLKSLMDTTGPGYKVKYIKLTSDLEYTGTTQWIEGCSCLLFALGTDSEEQFVRERYYGVSDNLIYTYDAVSDTWSVVGRQ